MNKFLSSISNGKKTLEKRSKSIGTAAEVAQSNLVNFLKNEITKLELKESDLTDFSPETSDSLRPGSKDWDAEKWVKELQETRQNLYDLRIQYKIAQDTYDEYFKED